MNASILDLDRFVRQGMAAQAAVDHALERAELVHRVATRKRQLAAVRLKRDDDVTDARLRLGAAVAALEDFEQAGRAPG